MDREDPAHLHPGAASITMEEADLIAAAFDDGSSQAGAALEEMGIRTWRRADGSQWIYFGVEDLPDGPRYAYCAARDQLKVAGVAEQHARDATRAMRRARGLPVMQQELYERVYDDCATIYEVLDLAQLRDLGEFSRDRAEAFPEERTRAYQALLDAGFQVGTYEQEEDIDALDLDCPGLIDGGASEEGVTLKVVTQIATGRAWVVDVDYAWTSGKGDEAPPPGQGAIVL